MRKRTKVISLAVALLLIAVVVLTACAKAPAAGPTTTVTVTAPASPGAPAPTVTVTAPAAPAPTVTVTSTAPVKTEYNWKLSHMMPRGNPIDDLMLVFAEMVDYYSGGKAKVEVVPAGAHGAMPQVTELVQKQQLEFAYVYPYGFLNPKFELVEAPGLFRDRNEALAMLYNGGYMDKWMEKQWAAIGLKDLFTLGSDFFGVFTKKPVRTPADLKGMKIRSTGVEGLVEGLKRLGAVAAPIPYAEVYPGLQTGLLDGCIAGGFYGWSQKWFEQAKNYSDINFAYDVTNVVMNVEYFNKLPKDIQDAIVKAAKMADYIGANLYHWNNDFMAIPDMKAKGVTIVSLTAAERQAFFDLLKPEELLDTVVVKNVGKEGVDGVKAALKELRAK
ncbi:MAG: TRAP transporter substrate-binding protein [Chloroflexi bacterium]|nr:TRAP transporter substrate-binding protein [Chloroflexota bacterium]